MRDINQELAKLYSKRLNMIHSGVGFGVIASSKSADFSPTDISNLHAWYDASDLSTITKDGLHRVSKWDDKSGNGHHLTQATGGSQPLWVDNDRNGKDVIDFSGDRYMDVAFTSISQPNTIVGVVVLPDTDSGGTRFAFASQDGSKRNDFFATTTANTYGLASASAISGSAGEELVWADVYTLFDGANSILDIKGSQIVTGDVGGEDLGGFTAMAFAGGSNFGNQKAAELIVYDKEVSGSEKTSLMSYLQDKWGF